MKESQKFVLPARDSAGQREGGVRKSWFHGLKVQVIEQVSVSVELPILITAMWRLSVSVLVRQVSPTLFRVELGLAGGWGGPWNVDTPPAWCG
jgi:hypothetical protein